MIKILVSHGANIEVRDDKNTTPLELAIHLEHHEIVDFLEKQVLEKKIT